MLKGRPVSLDVTLGSLRGEKLIVFGGSIREDEKAPAGVPTANPTIDVTKIPDIRKQKLIAQVEAGVDDFPAKFDTKYGPGAADAVLAEHREKERKLADARATGILVAPGRKRGRTRNARLPATSGVDLGSSSTAAPVPSDDGALVDLLGGGGREGGEGSEALPENVTVTAKCAKSGQAKVIAGLNGEHTVQELRRRVAATGLASLQCRLIHSGKLLQDEHASLAEAGVIARRSDTDRQDANSPPLVVVLDK